jgi:NADPH:quinone reductase-like Zn-dependent oxidoreductase
VIEYLRIPSNAAWKVPSSSSKVSLREAPVYGIGFGTACQALYRRLDVPYPPAKVQGDQWFLVYGGSTSVGLFAVQLAKLAGYKVVATASQRNFDLVKSYGADEVVDYHDSLAAIRQIRSITNNSLIRGLDTITEKGSLKIALESFADNDDNGKRKLSILLLIPDESKMLAQSRGIHVETNWVYTCISDVSAVASSLHRKLTPRRPSTLSTTLPSRVFPRTASSTPSSAKTPRRSSKSTASVPTPSRIWRVDSRASSRASS